MVYTRFRHLFPGCVEERGFGNLVISYVDINSVLVCLTLSFSSLDSLCMCEGLLLLFFSSEMWVDLLMLFSQNFI
jgi:hypothetical protein